MRWLPGSQVGKWAVTLAGLAVGGAVGLTIAFSLGLEPADSFTDNWALTGAGGAILVSGAASLVAGLDALLRRHDRSWLVISAILLGGLVAALMLQQVAEGLGWLAS